MSVENPTNRPNIPVVTGPNADFDGFIRARVTAAIETMHQSVIGLVWQQLAAAQRRLSLAFCYGRHPALSALFGKNRRLASLAQYASEFASYVIDGVLGMYPLERESLASTAADKSTETLLKS